MLIALTVCIFLLSTLILYQITVLVTRRQNYLAARLKDTMSYSAPAGFFKESVRSSHKIRGLLHHVSLPGSIFGKKYNKKLETSLIRSGLPLKAEELIFINLAASIIMALMGFLLFGNILAILLFGLLGFFLPGIWVNLVRKKRVIKIEEQLLNATVLLASSLRAGHSFLQSLELVSRESPPPLADEFAKVIRETKIGITVEEALENLVYRIDSKDIEMVVTGVLIQRLVGGNLAEVLDSIAYTIDKRIKTKAKIRALTAQPRLSALIISLLPVVLALFIYLRKADFLAVLVTDPSGRILFMYGIISFILGVFLLQKVVDIDV